MFKIHTREPGPVSTWEPGPVLVYVLTRTRFCTHGPISVTHTVFYTGRLLL